MMKKKKDDLDAWRKQYPGIVSRRTVGDDDVAALYNGEAKVLLWQIKNRMRLGNLDQLQRSVSFRDGTVVRVASIFGNDTVEIDVTRSTLVSLLGECSIVFLDTPLIVQPMRYPGVIGRGQVGADGYPETYHFPTETEGVDYIKTYYRFGSKETRLTEEWLEGCTAEVCTLRIRDTIADNNCNPFSYDDSSVTHVEDRCEGPLARVHDELNHCLETTSMCFGDVIEKGVDSGGKFVLWKVYSEYACFFPALYQLFGLQSRTGYGVFRLKVAYKNSAGKEICVAYQDVVMDCCQKDPALRVPMMWWEFCMAGSSFYQYGSSTLCPVSSGPIDPWWAWRQGDVLIYNLAELTGACLPYRWTLTGPGGIGNWCTNFQYDRKEVADGESCWYVAPEDIWTNPTCEDAVITVRDRCGNSDHVTFSCCQVQELAGGIFQFVNYDGLPLSVVLSGYNYTLMAWGGCPPYTWTATNATVTWDPGGWVAHYTADVNVDCLKTYSLTIKDCCGKEYTGTILVTASTAGSAGVHAEAWRTSDPYTCYSCSVPYCMDCYATWSCNKQIWNCEGTLTTNDAVTDQWVITEGGGYGHCAPPYGDNLPDCVEPGDTACDWGWECSIGSGLPCGTYDLRTALMMTLGCCPIDPNTGLPM